MDSLPQLIEDVQSSGFELDTLPTLYNFAVCMVMAFVLREFYARRSFSLTGKAHIASILPILSAVVFIVIVVVKSSLALSLGLVGALSIVRFRTPIKEPEELVYLFLAIALGLGYGAGFTMITTILVLATLVIIFFWLSNRTIASTSEYNMVVNWSEDALPYNRLVDTIEGMADSLKLVRMDRGPAGNTAVMLVSPKENVDLDHVVTSLRDADPTLNVSFYEAKTNW
jgi:hypothetical protein